MALDEPKDTDIEFEDKGIKLIIDEVLLEEVKSIEIDFSNLGFKIKTENDVLKQDSACKSCSSCSN